MAMRFLVLAVLVKSSLSFFVETFDHAHGSAHAQSKDPAHGSAHAQVQNFCHDLDCPKYTVLQSFNGYELRRYEATQWAACKVITKNYEQQENSAMFFSLFRYISGNNTAATKIPMTAPVLKTVSPDATGSHESVYEMHFMIPHNMQPFPPTPTESSVYITSLPPMDVYVKSFGGFVSENDNTAEVKALKQAINNSTLYDDRHYFTAGYDGPYTIIGRHNEVWLLKRN